MRETFLVGVTLAGFIVLGRWYTFAQMRYWGSRQDDAPEEKPAISRAENAISRSATPATDTGQGTPHAAESAAVASERRR